MAASTDSNRALKFVVISMGLVLIGGTILLFALIFSKVGKERADADIYIPKGYRDCAESTIALDAGETISSIEFDDMIARVTTDLPDGESRLKLVHSCSGELLGSVTFTHGPSPH